MVGFGKRAVVSGSGVLGSGSYFLCLVSNKTQILTSVPCHASDPPVWASLVSFGTTASVKVV